MLRLKKVAVTGGLSSGKSTVCRIFRKLGAHVVSADEIVHQLLSPKTPLGHEIIRILGSEVVERGSFNRQAIAKKVFNNPQLLTEFEKTLHPAVYTEMEREFTEVLKKGQTSLFIAEIPLLFETGGESWFDAVISVEAPDSICLDRFILNGGTEEQYQKRMQRQWNAAEKSLHSHYVIRNEGTIPTLESQVADLYQSLT